MAVRCDVFVSCDTVSSVKELMKWHCLNHVRQQHAVLLVIVTQCIVDILIATIATGLTLID
jgi:hypothetical protein